MTDKLERLARIEAEAAALRKEIKAEQVKTPCFTPEHKEAYYHFNGCRNGEHFTVDRFYANRCPRAAFRDQKTAEAYAEAFNVMLELRVYADGGEWYIEDGADDVISAHLAICDYTVRDAFGGRYSSKAQAQKAIDAVGEDRIIQAIKTLCGVL